ncbi:hypothetical protein H072_4132 [Dactylellina haptotyla CBS 200.50]|uniref:Uncharacterized protein n=1 Tax=Dactylellina haptotyla (strain CBS 200.50) TaxID=1284197 RepID=S8BR62_DACHA|nr:hypothetical protein H072_4132 [Dactylellina haptotyla CBS 200.50]
MSEQSGPTIPIVASSLAGADAVAAEPQESALPEDVLPLFQHPLDPDAESLEPLTFREQYLRAFSQAIRGKPNWTEKVLDRALFAKWLREAQVNDTVSNWRKILTWDKDDVQFVYDELVNKYKPYVEELQKDPASAGVEPDMDLVWRTDTLVDESLKKELLDAVATLENVPDDKKDWHPGSDGQVLDLVHPSLWPVIYGRSISLVTGKPIELPDDAIDDSYSDQFCWLPSEFEVSEDGKVKIASYINNLSSPEQEKIFYPILERIFEKFVPLFNQVLADLADKKQDLRRVDSPDGYVGDSEDLEWLMPEKHKELWDKMLGEFEKGEDMTVDFAESIELFEDDEDDENGVSGDAKREELENSYWRSREDDKVDPAPFQVRDMGTLSGQAWSPPKITNELKLQGKTAKVIVKLANILLTPETPEYEGGSWHVEAMMNERIISTGIYYYDQENITDSFLSFRRTIQDMEDLSYSLPQDSNWTTVHNMGREGNSVQNVGKVLTKKDRAIVFPNVYQHRVKPFKLIDKEKPGYRKILVFFLCDPSPENKVPTSKVVAPQQPEARGYLEEALRLGPLGKMPEEVFRLIVEALPPVVTREEAEKYRQDLMNERSTYIAENELIQGVHYSLCEH